jgi:hypothetical protein
MNAETPIPRCVNFRVRFVIPKGAMPPHPVTVHVCVDADRKLAAAPLLVDSSGYPGIDMMALDLAKQGNYKSAMPSGMTVPGCFNYTAFSPEKPPAAP